jgi:hypothetical protein
MNSLSLSGDTILIDQNHIVKICKTEQQRFLRNVEKQKRFNNPYISAVPVVEQGIMNGQNYIKMPLFQCENPLYWISKASIEDIEIIIYLVTQYLDSIVQTSRIRNFDLEAWSNKVTAVKKQIQDTELKDVCNKLLQIDGSVPFHYGAYHGDFTLSNMFISRDQNISIDVIDFLDAFIESPIHDFVKLRQDTKHLWTLQLVSDLDINKIVIILNHIDKRVEKAITNNISLNHYYNAFQTLNLLRIIPYNKDPIIFKYLKKEILNVCYPDITVRR